MSSIVDCFEDISARINDIVGRAGERLPNMGLGDQAKFRTEAPPRIVWVPVGGPIRRPRQAGGDQISNPRQLWERGLQIEARIWHVDIPAAEGLANHFAAAVQEAGTGSYSILQETWDTSGVQQLGVQIVLLFSVTLPFTDEPQGAVKLGSAPVTGAFATG